MRAKLSALALALGACQHLGGEPVPAVIADEEGLAAMDTALTDALGRARIDYGKDDPRTKPLVTVLPPPLAPAEDRSTALPQIFDITLARGTCRLTERSGAFSVELDNRHCRAL